MTNSQTYCLYGYKHDDSYDNLGTFSASSVKERTAEAKQMIRSLSKTKKKKYDRYTVSKCINVRLGLD